jgi:hypothetical protein
VPARFEARSSAEECDVVSLSGEKSGIGYGGVRAGKEKEIYDAVAGFTMPEHVMMK